MKHWLAFFSLFIFYLLLFTSCKKDTFITSGDASIAINADSVKFDTVFTSVGSVTQSFTIANPNSQKLLISAIKLMGGANSPFKININGMVGPEADNIEIDPNDSIYIFVSVTINPNAVNLSFIVSDSILISYNGNYEYVQLQAYGQNAHFIRSQLITGNVTWTDSLPYVILGGVQVDSAATLTIQPHSRIYLHADAPFLVDGTLIVNGTKQDSVIFTGDRLDDGYNNLPASWPGIYFRTTSINNVLTHAVIENAYQAVVIADPASNANPKVTLHQCIINNSYDAGILCINSSLNIDNSLISNCGSNVELTGGGDYNLVNCTDAAYGNIYVPHKNPVLQVNNYDASTGTIITNNLNALFQNCIFWGDDGQNITDEITIDKQGSNSFNVLFDHSLYKAADVPANTSFNLCIANIDPKFDSINVNLDVPYYDFHISDSTAPGIGKGVQTLFTKDLDDLPRSIGGLTDIGCYEKQ